jgi:hypothetical protein
VGSRKNGMERLYEDKEGLSHVEAEV